MNLKFNVFTSNPSPVNSGQHCTGESTQTSDCSVICNPIHGSWTSWSSWSTCSHECSQVRRRICSNPPPKHGGQHCIGHDFLIKNCTGGMCRKLVSYRKHFLTALMFGSFYPNI
ncbi:unnamed protein product [Medioppia subpectinata]|uniref:Uncharacterized protein n=1 Tax=Medioppia subpectinata TaxID=1979941 RepID=A0A7R9KPV3_9ACAR|nr:unnamed protein product [Medioppia subpectinata]CAG2107584.1 unnamed protein product [Medioppia subpectinata]